MPGVSLGAWPPGGIAICQACNASRGLIVADGAGGAFIAWDDVRNGNDDVYVQRITGAGEIAPGWPVDGLAVCTNPSSQFVGLPAADGLGGVLVAWSDLRNAVPGGTNGDIYAQRILADGTIAPGWPLDGAPVTRAPARQDFPSVVADGTGGGFFTWDETTRQDIYLQHLAAAGGVSSGWPADGLPICTLPSGQGSPQLAADGAGGVLMAWGDLRDGPLAAYAERVTPAGQLAPGWPEDGVRIVLNRALRQIISDGVGGAYLSCATPGPVFDDGLFLQRFTGAAAISPGWPDGGVPVCQAPDERNGLRMVLDGAGGALLAWADYRDSFDDDLFALRVRPDGTHYPGWPLDGLRVTDNTALDDSPDLAPDGAGGAYLTWDHYTTAVGDRVYVQRLAGDGTLAPGWPGEGAQIPSDQQPGGMMIVSDDQGGAIVTWNTWDGARGQDRALRYGANGVVAVSVSMAKVDTEPGLVRLTWMGGGTQVFRGTVERRTETSEWLLLSTIETNGTGKMIYEDRDVAPGMHYAYRLSYPDGGSTSYTAETWVTVPALRFALRGLAPNPSQGDPVVAFSLARPEPAFLELYDLSGRSVLSREVGSLGTGAHSLRLGARLPAGVYSLRLRQGEAIATTRAVILR
jgi:hypothetical protein